MSALILFAHKSFTGQQYKFFCFNGQPEFVELYIDRFGNHKKLFCDMNWNVAGFTTANDVAKVTVEQPKEFAEMKEVAKALCKGRLLCASIYMFMVARSILVR